MTLYFEGEVVTFGGNVVQLRIEQRDQQKRERSLLRRLVSWQVLVPTASIAIGLLSLMVAFLALQEPVPGITYETISDSNVLDVRRPLQDLSIEFRGQDVQEQDLSLRILTINVVNSGEVDILPGQYDQEDDWGLKFNRGEVIEARLVDASSDYLQARLIPTILESDSVAFPKVIFERDAVFAVEVLILHPKTESPRVSSMGKIAGIDHITVSARPLARQNVSFISQVLQGNPLVHVVRAVGYSIISLVTMVVAILLIAIFVVARDERRSRKRREQILGSRTIREMDRSDISAWLVELYEKNGIARLRKLQGVVGNPEDLVFVGPLDDSHEGDDFSSSNWVGSEELWDNDFGPLEMRTMLRKLESMGLLQKGEGYTAELDPTFRKTLDMLVRELGG